jgi:hypothetical protein
MSLLLILNFDFVNSGTYFALFVGSKRNQRGVVDPNQDSKARAATKNETKTSHN